MKALAASGLPLNLPTASLPGTSAVPSSAAPAPTTSGQTSSTSTFPVFVPTSPAFPISPAPSDSSSSSTLFDSVDFDSTRHLARVATADAPRLSSVSLQRVDPNVRQIASSWNSIFPQQHHTRRSSTLARVRQPRWTKSPWTISSAKSSRLPLLRRRLLFLLARRLLPRTRPPGPDPSRYPKSNSPQPRPPLPRRR